MHVTTTPSIEGRKIVRYRGIVAGETILGANICKELFAGIRNLKRNRKGLSLELKS
jgi:uncharacterized protein YbjQ (UPF0145 family)